MARSGSSGLSPGAWGWFLGPPCQAAEVVKGSACFNCYLIDTVQEEEGGSRDVPPSPLNLLTNAPGDHLSEL